MQKVEQQHGRALRDVARLRVPGTTVPQAPGAGSPARRQSHLNQGHSLFTTFLDRLKDAASKEDDQEFEDSKAATEKSYYTQLNVWSSTTDTPTERTPGEDDIFNPRSGIIPVLTIEPSSSESLHMLGVENAWKVVKHEGRHRSIHCFLAGECPLVQIVVDQEHLAAYKKAIRNSSFIHLFTEDSYHGNKLGVNSSNDSVYEDSSDASEIYSVKLLCHNARDELLKV